MYYSLVFLTMHSFPAYAADGPEPSLGAFVSPGMLAKAHAELDVMTGCTSCHTPGTDDRPSAVCFSTCHDTIREQVTARGLHGRDSRAACSDCHPDHRGRDFALVDYARYESATSASDHLLEAGFALEGAHAALACRACHLVVGAYAEPALDACDSCHVAEGVKATWSPERKAPN